MQTRLKTFLALACLAVVASVSVFAADISGQWTASINTMMGAMPWSWSFKLDGTKLTGTSTSNGEDIAIENGKIEGGTISFSETRTLGPLGPTKIEYTGKIVSSDEIQFSRKVGELGKEDFVAKRPK